MAFELGVPTFVDDDLSEEVAPDTSKLGQFSAEASFQKSKKLSTVGQAGFVDFDTDMVEDSSVDPFNIAGALAMETLIPEEEKGFWKTVGGEVETVGEKWTRGSMSMILDIATFTQDLAQFNQGFAEKHPEFLESFTENFEQSIGNYGDLKAKNFWWKTVGDTMEMLPGMGLGMAASTATRSPWGGRAVWTLQGAGMLSREINSLVEEGMIEAPDPKAKLGATLAFGFIYAAIESSQASKFKGNATAKKVIGKYFGKSLKRKIALHLLQSTMGAGKQIIEEGTQKVLEDIFTDSWKELQGTEEYRAMPKTDKAFYRNFFAEMKATAPPLILLSFITAGFGVGRIRSESRKSGRDLEILDKMHRNIVDTLDQMVEEKDLIRGEDGGIRWEEVELNERTYPRWLMEVGGRTREEVQVNMSLMARAAQQSGHENLTSFLQESWERFPSAAEMSEGFVVTDDVAIELEQQAFHGGARVFESEEGFPHGRFKLEEIGTGEGAQAFGHGIYLAEAPGVASSYTTTGRFTSVGKILDEKFSDLSAKDRKDVSFEIELSVSGSQTSQDVEARLKERLKTGTALDQAAVLARERAIEVVQDPRFEEGFSGSFYRVEIPEDVQGNLLDWDAQLSPEQEAIINEQLSKEGHASLSELSARNARGGQGTGREAYWKIGLALGKGVVKEKEASELLARAGIVGSRYLDQQSRPGNVTPSVTEPQPGIWTVQNPNTGREVFRGESQQEAQEFADALPELKLTRNFVIWDQPTLDRISLMEKNGEVLDQAKEDQAKEDQEAAKESRRRRGTRIGDLGVGKDLPVAEEKLLFNPEKSFADANSRLKVIPSSDTAPEFFTARQINKEIENNREQFFAEDGRPVTAIDLIEDIKINGTEVQQIIARLFSTNRDLLSTIPIFGFNQEPNSEGSGGSILALSSDVGAIEFNTNPEVRKKENWNSFFGVVLHEVGHVLTQNKASLFEAGNMENLTEEDIRILTDLETARLALIEKRKDVLRRMETDFPETAGLRVAESLSDKEVAVLDELAETRAGLKRVGVSVQQVPDSSSGRVDLPVLQIRRRRDKLTLRLAVLNSVAENAREMQSAGFTSKEIDTYKRFAAAELAVSKARAKMWSGGTTIEYQTKDLAEFITGIFTEPEFQAILSRIRMEDLGLKSKTDDGGFLSGLLVQVKELLGIRGARANSAFDQLFRQSMELYKDQSGILKLQLLAAHEGGLKAKRRESEEGEFISEHQKAFDEFLDDFGPTKGSCLKCAIKFAMKIEGDYIEGIIEAGMPPRPILHAWVEKDGNVFDPTTGLITSKEKFLSATSAQELHREDGTDAMLRSVKVREFKFISSPEGWVLKNGFMVPPDTEAPTKKEIELAQSPTQSQEQGKRGKAKKKELSDLSPELQAAVKRRNVDFIDGELRLPNGKIVTEENVEALLSQDLGQEKTAGRDKVRRTREERLVALEALPNFRPDQKSEEQQAVMMLSLADSTLGSKAEAIAEIKRSIADTVQNKTDILLALKESGEEQGKGGRAKRKESEVSIIEAALESASLFNDLSEAQKTEFRKLAPQYIAATQEMNTALGKERTFRRATDGLLQELQDKIDGIVALLHGNNEAAFTFLAAQADLSDLQIPNAALTPQEIKFKNITLDNVQTARDLVNKNKAKLEDASLTKAQISEFSAQLAQLRDSRDALQDQRSDRVKAQADSESKSTEIWNKLQKIEDGLGTYLDEEISRSEEQGKGLSIQQKSPEGITQGQVTFQADSKGILQIFKNAADKSTLIHEHAHFYLKYIEPQHWATLEEFLRSNPERMKILDGLETDEVQIVMEKFAGGNLGNLSPRERDVFRQLQESFARGFEQYTATQRAPTKSLRVVFEKFREWVRKIYKENKAILGPSIPLEMQKVYDSLFVSENEKLRGQIIIGDRRFEVEPDEEDRPIVKVLWDGKRVEIDVSNIVDGFEGVPQELNHAQRKILAQGNQEISGTWISPYSTGMSEDTRTEQAQLTRTLTAEEVVDKFSPISAKTKPLTANQRAKLESNRRKEQRKQLIESFHPQIQKPINQWLGKEGSAGYEERRGVIELLLDHEQSVEDMHYNSSIPGDIAEATLESSEVPNSQTRPSGVKQKFSEAATGTKVLGNEFYRNYVQTLIDRIRTVGNGGPFQGWLADKIQAQANQAAKFMGDLDTPLLHLEALVGNRLNHPYNAAASNMRGIEWEGRAGYSRIENAVEGRLPVELLGEKELEIVRRVRTLIKITGEMAERIPLKIQLWRPAVNEKGESIIEKDKEVDFVRSVDETGEPNKFPRQVAEGFWNLINDIKGREQLAEILSEQNPDWKKKDLDNLLLKIHKQARTRQINMELQRNIPNFPSMVRIRGIKGRETVVRLLESDPLHWSRALVHNISLRLAFVQEFGQDSKEHERLRDILVPTSHDESRAHDDFDYAWRAMNGVPLNPEWRLNPTGIVYPAVKILRAAGAVWKASKLGQAWMVNVAEPLQKLPTYGGWRRLGGAYADIRKEIAKFPKDFSMAEMTLKMQNGDFMLFEDLKRSLVNTGIISHDIMHFVVRGDSGTVNYLNDVLQNTARTLMKAEGITNANAMNELISALVGQRFVRDLIEGKTVARDRYRLMQLGFQNSEIDTFMEGNANEKMNLDLMRRMVSKSQGTNLQTVENTYFSQHPIAREIFFFDSFFRVTLRSGIQIASHAIKVMKDETANAEEKSHAWQGLIQWTTGHALGGAIGLTIRALIIESPKALLLSEFGDGDDDDHMDDILDFVLKSFVVGAVSGPAASVYWQYNHNQDEQHKNLFGAMATATTLGGMMADVQLLVDFAKSDNMFRGLPLREQTWLLANRLANVTVPIYSVLNMLHVGSKDLVYTKAKRKHYDFLNRNFGRGSYDSGRGKLTQTVADRFLPGGIQSLKDQREIDDNYELHMRKARAIWDRQDSIFDPEGSQIESIREEIQLALGFAKGDSLKEQRRSVAESIRNRKLLKKYITDDPEVLRKYKSHLGEAFYEVMIQHDTMLEAWARQVMRGEVKELKGKDEAKLDTTARKHTLPR